MLFHEVNHWYRILMDRREWIRRARLWLPPVLYMVAIFYLSSQSAPLPAVTVRVWDKLLHLVEYGCLAVLFCRALIGERVGCPAALLGAIILTSAYGASDEWHQLYTPLRSADVRDWLADTIGGVAGAASFGFCRRIVRPRSEHEER
jgi:VanZ family protein